MVENTLIINGVDFTPYVAMFTGLKIEDNNIDGPNAGRTEDGKMRRERIIITPSISITFNNKRLNRQTAFSLYNALAPEMLNVSYFDLRKNKLVSARFYAGTPSYEILGEINGEVYFRLLPITLIAEGIPGDGLA